MKLWMKALVWLGLGGGIGFFAGYQVGYNKNKITMEQTYDEIVSACEEKIRKEYEAEIGKANAEIRKIRKQAQEALDAQREYLGGKDDEVIDDAEMPMEPPEMPDDPFHEEEDDEEEEEAFGDTDGDEIQQFHPEDLLPVPISAAEYLQGMDGYGQMELDYYTEDCVIFDPNHEEKWTHPEQLLGYGWKALFISQDGRNRIREAYIRNDSMAELYKITRIDDSFARLYEEE